MRYRSVRLGNMEVGFSSVSDLFDTDEAIHRQQVDYYLKIDQGDEKIDLNGLLGKKIRIDFKHRIFCKNCGKFTKKSFQGFCFICSRSLAEADLCQVRPETCHFEKGTCRDEVWAKNNCFIEHSLYLSYTSGVKVGITRTRLQRVRWVDQGALFAVVLGYTSDRLHVGILEHELKKILPDKTHWKRMLKKNLSLQDDRKDIRDELNQARDQAIDEIESFFKKSKHGSVRSTQDREKSFHFGSGEYYEFEYPQWLSEDDLNSRKMNSISLDKQTSIYGKLVGIKGQYLYLENEEEAKKDMNLLEVFNIRKFIGYEVDLEID